MTRRDVQIPEEQAIANFILALNRRLSQFLRRYPALCPVGPFRRQPCVSPCDSGCILAHLVEEQPDQLEQRFPWVIYEIITLKIPPQTTNIKICRSPDEQGWLLGNSAMAGSQAWALEARVTARQPHPGLYA